jgi:hypothetical protein
LHIRFEADSQFGDTHIDTVPEGVKLIVVSAIQHFLFDEAPQPLNQVQVWGVRRQIKEFYSKLCGLVGNRPAFLLSRIVQY